MILDELNITKAKYTEYLDKFIDNESLSEALTDAGLLPFRKSLQVEPKIISSGKLDFNKGVYKDVIKIQFFENSVRNQFAHSFKVSTISEKELQEETNTKEHNFAAAA